MQYDVTITKTIRVEADGSADAYIRALEKFNIEDVDVVEIEPVEEEA